MSTRPSRGNTKVVGCNICVSGPVGRDGSLTSENGAVLCGVVVAVVVHMRQGTGDGPTGCCADGSGVLPRGLLVTLPWWFLPWVICISALPRHSIVTITRTCVCVCVE